MSKSDGQGKNRRRGPSTDVHARIALEAFQVRKKEKTGPAIQAMADSPELSALFQSACTTLSKSIPASFEHEGRTYWLKVYMPKAIGLIVYDDPADPEPMALALAGGSQEFGHIPPAAAQT